VAGSPRPLSTPDVESRLRARFGEDILEVAEQQGHSVASVSPLRYHDLCRFLRDEPEFGCDYCDFTTAVDFGAEGGLEVVTHLFSTQHHHSVRIKVRLPSEGATLPTISDLWATCDWNERETAEMFGITFEGHPKPVKLLLSEPFEGHPLRKDFPLMSREAKPWPGVPEGEEVEDD
jgi:NADH-quinone oxidoreductase subunit C